jgi:hypothetical protein
MNPGIPPLSGDYSSPDYDLEQLNFLLSVLNESKALNFSLSGTGISSIRAATDLIIDLLTKLSQLFKEGSSLSEQVNPEIGFSEWHQDALGNPKQFRIAQSRKQYWNESLGKELMDLACRFVALKRTDFEGSLYLPSLAHREKLLVDDNEISPKGFKNRKPRKNKRYHYYRIRQRRKAESHAHFNSPKKVEDNDSKRVSVQKKHFKKEWHDSSGTSKRGFRTISEDGIFKRIPL